MRYLLTSLLLTGWLSVASAQHPEQGYYPTPGQNPDRPATQTTRTYSGSSQVQVATGGQQLSEMMAQLPACASGSGQASFQGDGRYITCRDRISKTRAYR